MTQSIDWPTRDLLAHRVTSTPERTALVDAETGESWTCRELDARVSDVAGRLAGVASRGDRIGVLLSNRVEVVELAHAAMRRGATLVPLNVRLTAAELVPQVELADLDLLVCESDTEERASVVAGCRVASINKPAREDVLSLQSWGDGTAESVRIDRDEEGIVMFTSGTTGDPKGVRLTWGNLVASATASAFRLGVSPDDRWLVTLPTYHMGGLAPIFRSALYGTAVVLQESFDVERTAQVVEEFGVTGISLVPTMLSRLLDAGWEPPEHLRFVLLGGAPASRELIERCREREVPVHPTYGMTETASQVATARPSQAFEHPGTVGQSLVFTDVRIEDESGEPCGLGEPGAIVVSGPTVSPGYLDDEHTAESFDGRGFHTGDVGYRDEDGRLWVVGRLDDVVITGGENVHPGEVVDVLRAHPEVRDAAIVGLPDEEWGECVAALVVPNDGSSVDRDALRDHCEERLAGYKRPRTIEFASELPRTPSGTVDREAVQERLKDEDEY